MDRPTPRQQPFGQPTHAFIPLSLMIPSSVDTLGLEESRRKLLETELLSMLEQIDQTLTKLVEERAEEEREERSLYDDDALMWGDISPYTRLRKIIVCYYKIIN